jgi:hypothetical protein
MRIACLARFSCVQAPPSAAVFGNKSLVAITTVGAFVFPLVIVGMMEASTTRNIDSYWHPVGTAERAAQLIKER